MTKSDLLHLRTILDACTGLDEIRDRVRSARDLDSRPNDLAMAGRLLRGMGEAAKNVTPVFHAVHSEIPWNRLIRMHNRLANPSFGIDYEAVWATIEQDIPPLETQVRAALTMADAWWGGDKGSPSDPGRTAPSRSVRVGP
ncbi:MAG: HepT-like ribonuclease domain-containing protein [Methanospirillum sp.]